MTRDVYTWTFFGLELQKLAGVSGELARGVHNNYESTLHNNNIHVSGAGGNLYDLVIKGNHKGAAQD